MTHHLSVVRLSGHQLSGSIILLRVANFLYLEGVENQLHWVKDVVFNEDLAQMVNGYAGANFSILRSSVINLFRSNGFDSLTKAIEHCVHNIQLLFSFLE